METVLSRRQLNRALLERQLLLRREAMPVAEAVEHLVGLQCQVPAAPFHGLWARLEGFDPEELSRLLEERQVARMALFRWTQHLVTARDALALRPLLQTGDRAADALLAAASARRRGPRRDRRRRAGGARRGADARQRDRSRAARALA
jgi:hypothetical protein